METDAKDDVKGESNDSRNAASQAVHALGAAAFERHRPSASTANSNATPALDEALGSATQALPVDPDHAARDREMARSAIVGICRFVSSTVERSMRAAARRISGDEVFASTFAAEVTLSESEVQNIGDLGTTVAEKYGLLTWAKFGPEIALAVAVGRYGTTVVFAIQKLNAMEKEKKCTIETAEKQRTATGL